MSENDFSRSRRLRIVHCFRAPIGGVFRHARDLAEAQTAAGHAVGILCDAGTAGALGEPLLARLDQRLELGVRRIPMQRHVGLHDIAAGFQTFKAIRGLKLDVLHGHGAKGGVYARLLGTLARGNIRRFYSPHGGSLHFDPATAKGRLIFAAEHVLERLSDGLFFVCDFEKQSYARNVGQPKTQWQVVHNGLGPEDFEPVPVTDDPFDILFIGEIRTEKGPDLLIRSIAAVEAGLGRRLRTLIVGHGRYLESCKSLAVETGVAARVEFRPPMPARQAFELARLVVMPSRAEAFPYVVLEALAAGRPIIASPAGGIPEIFGQDTAALAEPNVEALSSKMIEALSDLGGFQSRMPSRSTIKARFSVEMMARRITEAYTTAGQ